jgi:flavin-dependent dehydrogenase
VETVDAVVVGGGPAGSACAARLVRAGMDVAVLDREEFPRTKLCAGWITPRVVADLELDLASYPHRLNTFGSIVVHLYGLTFELVGPQHSIRRFEFDDFLLRRSGARVLRHTAREIRREPGGYVVDDRVRGRFLVGAGGTRCPVYRTFFRAANPRARELQVATLEHEWPHAWSDPRCHLWFFDGGLPGYAWYVPKADGFLNCGLGGMARRIERRGTSLKEHWRRFARRLAREGLVEKADFEPRGYTYYLRGAVETVRVEDALLAGDAVGLATRDLCEGIGPAVESGQRAAEAILTGADYTLLGVPAYSAERRLVRRLLERWMVAA